MFILWIAAGTAAGLAIFGRPFFRNYIKYRKYRGDRVITCPENQRPAGVRVDASHAMFTGLGKADLRLSSCSRWPAHKDCGQECLRQVEAAPEDCLVRHILTQWYEGKHCALCGKPIGEINWTDHKPALLNAQHETVQWQDVPAEDVPDVLASHKAVCWNCHIVNTMIMHHPELIVDRSRHV